MNGLLNFYVCARSRKATLSVSHTPFSAHACHDVTTGKDDLLLVPIFGRIGTGFRMKLVPNQGHNLVI
jgi:hypothetical protein